MDGVSEVQRERHTAPPGAAGPAVSRRDAGAVAVLALLSLIIQLPFLDSGISFYDEGSILAIADGLRHGGVMYRDHVTPTAPLTYELLRLLFDLFGPHLLVGRLFQAAVFTLSTLLVYGVLRQFMGTGAAAVGALAMLPVKTLGFPLWTIVNYSQLALLFGLAAVLAMLRYLATLHWRWLVLTGVAVGLTTVTKQNLGAFIGLTVAATFTLHAGSARDGTLRRWVGGGAVLCVGFLPAVAATAGFYAHQGALSAAVDRALFGLSYLTQAYALPFPVPLGHAGIGEVMFTYFPSPLAQLGWRGDVVFEESPRLYFAIVHAVQVAYVLPLAALLAAVAIGAREWFAGVAPRALIAWVLVLLFGALAYASMLYRPDWTHLMNVAPALILVIVLVAERLSRRHRWARWGATTTLGLWFLAGGAAAASIFAAYDTPVETPRGRLFAPAVEAESTRRLLAHLTTDAGSGSIMLLRAEPLFYFLADRRMPTAFDLVMPGLLGPGDDARIRDDLRRADKVVYNPKKMLTVPAPITEYAPLTAAALAEGFRIAAVLSPTAVVLDRGAAPPHAVTVVDLWQRFGDLRQFVNGGPPNPNSMPPRYEPVSWMMYRVLGTAIHERDQQACFDVAHGVGPDEAIAVTPMLHPITWAQVPGDPDYSRDLVGARFTIALRTPDARWKTVYSGEQPPGPPDERLRISLAPFAGRSVDIRFCAESLTPRPGKVYALPGWAEPRIVREGG